MRKLINAIILIAAIFSFLILSVRFINSDLLKPKEVDFEQVENDDDDDEKSGISYSDAIERYGEFKERDLSKASLDEYIDEIIQYFNENRSLFVEDYYDIVRQHNAFYHISYIQEEDMTPLRSHIDGIYSEDDIDSYILKYYDIHGTMEVAGQEGLIIEDKDTGYMFFAAYQEKVGKPAMMIQSKQDGLKSFKTFLEEYEFESEPIDKETYFAKHGYHLDDLLEIDVGGDIQINHLALYRARGDLTIQYAYDFLKDDKVLIMNIEVKTDEPPLVEDYETIETKREETVKLRDNRKYYIEKDGYHYVIDFLGDTENFTKEDQFEFIEALQ